MGRVKPIPSIHTDKYVPHIMAQFRRKMFFFYIFIKFLLQFNISFRILFQFCYHRAFYLCFLQFLASSAYIINSNELKDTLGWIIFIHHLRSTILNSLSKSIKLSRYFHFKGFTDFALFILLVTK